MADKPRIQPGNRRAEDIPLALVDPDPHNYNDHPPEQVAMIARSLDEFGQAKPVVVQATAGGRYTLAAGHGVALGAQRLGWATVWATVIPAEWGRERVRAYLVADNRTAEFGQHNDAALAALLQEIAAYDAELLPATGYTGDEADELVRRVLAGEQAENVDDAGPEIDRAEELRQKWGTELGQLWRLGDHRLICGDCTDPAVVERLMGGEAIDCIVTDPPYGVDYDGGTRKREKLVGDSSPGLYLPALSCWAKHCSDHVALYLWYADGDQAVAQAVAQAGWQVRRNLIWNKNLAQYGALSQQYKQKHEPFLYCHLKGKAPYWAGNGAEVTVWDIDRAAANKYHPTEKPPELFARAISNSSSAGAVVFDGFSGSGTTIIACETLARRARAIEISPAYVAVTLERFQQATGKTPELIP